MFIFVDIVVQDSRFRAFHEFDLTNRTNWSKVLAVKIIHFQVTERDN